MIWGAGRAARRSGQTTTGAETTPPAQSRFKVRFLKPITTSQPLGPFQYHHHGMTDMIRRRADSKNCRKM